MFGHSLPLLSVSEGGKASGHERVRRPADVVSTDLLLRRMGERTGACLAEIVDSAPSRFILHFSAKGLNF